MVDGDLEGVLLANLLLDLRLLLPDAVTTSVALLMSSKCFFHPAAPGFGRVLATIGDVLYSVFPRRGYHAWEGNLSAVRRAATITDETSIPLHLVPRLEHVALCSLGSLGSSNLTALWEAEI